MDNVEDLAGRTGQEVAEWRATLNNHVELLNGMNDKIDLFQDRVDDRFAKLDERFDKLEAKVDKGFTEIGLGMGQITALLNIHLGEPGTETSAGGAGE